MTTVSGVLVVDITAAAEGIGNYIEGRAAAALVPVIPHGVCVELHIRDCTPLDGLMGALIEELRPAGSVVVVGTSARGVAAMYQALSIGLAHRGAA